MLILGHQGGHVAPGELWSSWHIDPVVLLGLVLLGAAYARGWRASADGPRRRIRFVLALAALAVALLSPLDALSGTLVSAHMVQHVLLVVVAAPLLAWSAPGAALVRGLPAAGRRWNRRSRRGVGVGADALRHLRAPVPRLLLYIGLLWVWHSAALYGAAVDHDVVHALEHLSFVLPAWLVWTLVLGPDRVRLPGGSAVLLLFAMGLQTIFLSLLLTFAQEPWYAQYADGAALWGIDALQDQQLAGAIMWVPAGLVHTAIALAVFARWLRDIDRPVVASGHGPSERWAGTRP